MPPGRGSSSAAVPIHRTCCSGSTRNGQMVSGVASIMISRTRSVIGGSFVVLGGLGYIAQAFETGGPVVVEEVAKLLHLILAGPVQTPGAIAPLAHQSGLLQHAEVLRDGRASDVSKVVRDLRRRQLTHPHQTHDLPASGLRQCLEGCIHTLSVSVFLRKCQLTFTFGRQRD